MIASRFPSFLGHLECSQCPSYCSFFFPCLWGFFRVVKHHCRLIYTQLVDIYRGQGKLWKIRNNEVKSTFWGTWNMFFFINSEIVLTFYSLSRSFLDWNLKKNAWFQKKTHFFCKKRKLSAYCWNLLYARNYIN